MSDPSLNTTTTDSIIDNIPETEIQKIRDLAVDLTDKNRQYFRENEEEIREEYSGEMIAIIDQEIVAHEEVDGTEDKGKFVARLREQFGEEKIADSFISYIVEPDGIMML